jgi:hypothetical protein
LFNKRRASTSGIMFELMKDHMGLREATWWAEALGFH